MCSPSRFPNQGYPGTVLNAVAPADKLYGLIRARLENVGRPIGANDLLLASQAIALGYILASDNEREFSRVEDLAA